MSIRQIRKTALPIPLLVLLAAGCNTEPSSNPLPTGGGSADFFVSVEPSSVVLIPGESQQLRGFIRSGQGVFLPTPLQWTSADSSIASVSGGGLVTALKAGETVITGTPALGPGSWMATIKVLER